MQITLFGIFIIFFSLISLIKRKYFIYWYTFTLSLFGTTIGLIGKTPIRPFYLTTILMLLVYVRFDFFRKINFKNKDVFLLTLFILWIISSHFFSIFLSGQVNVLTSDLSFRDLDRIIPLAFSFSNLTQTIFPIFGVFMYLVVKAFIKNLDDVKLFTKAYYFTFFPLVITVVLFQFLKLSGNSAVILFLFDFINKANTQNVLKDYGAIGEMIRTFTYIGEPSFTAKYYCLLLVFILSFYIHNDERRIKKNYYILILLILVVLIITLGSTTGYIGLIITLIIYFLTERRISSRVVSKRFWKMNKNQLYVVSFLILCISIGYIFISDSLFNFISSYFTDNHLNKIYGEEGSGIARVNTSLYSFELLYKSPLFGVGYGNNRSNSYFTFLLANIGIIGFIIINIFFIRLIFKLIRIPSYIRLDTEYGKQLVIYYSIVVSSYIIYFTFSSTVAIAFGWFWPNVAILNFLLYKKNYN